MFIDNKKEIIGRVLVAIGVYIYNTTIYAIYFANNYKTWSNTFIAITIILGLYMQFVLAYLFDIIYDVLLHNKIHFSLMLKYILSLSFLITIYIGLFNLANIIRTILIFGWLFQFIALYNLANIIDDYNTKLYQLLNLDSIQNTNTNTEVNTNTNTSGTTNLINSSPSKDYKSMERIVINV